MSQPTPTAPARTPAPPRIALTGLRGRLAAGRAELFARAGQLPPAEFLHAHAGLLDGVLADAWRAADLATEHALIAVGGYGRGELHPYSDIDLLILLAQPPSADEGERLATLVGALWDLGLEVGHSVRTVEECVDMADDVTVQTNLLEARMLAGAPALFNALQARLAARLDARAFLQAKVFEQQQRHARFNDSAYSLEPNLKESPGGLRDLQTVLWVARAAGVARDWGRLAAQGLMSAAEARLVARDERFLQALRLRLHLLAGRREDRLLFDHQAALARAFGVTANDRRRESEALMQRYYQTAKAVTLFNQTLLQSLRARLDPAPAAPARLLNERFSAKAGNLEINAVDVFARQPAALFEAFELLQQNPDLAGMGPDTLRELWRARRYVNAAFRADPVNRAAFLRILAHPHRVTRSLREMNHTGLLGRYLPAFGRVVGQMQHDLFHVYTVDEHTLRVLRNLRRFTKPEFAHEFPLCSQLMQDFEPKAVLYLAALFHDIAKGRGGDHSALGREDALRFCLEHGLPEDQAHLVAWLVGDHLSMSATAQKKDLSDLEVIAQFALQMGSEHRLIALYLLTVADIRGTSPKVWNAWKGKLLEDLLRAACRLLKARDLHVALRDAPGITPSRKDDALALLRLYAVPEAAYAPLWKHLDGGYFVRHDAGEIAWHARRLQHQVDAPGAVVRARLSPVGEGLQVMLYGPDRDDLFARICAFFERVRLNILDAKVYTTRHGYALDTFMVMEEDRHDAHYRDLISLIEHDLARAVADTAPLPAPARVRLNRRLKHFPMTPEVRLEPDDRGLYCVLSVTAGDFPGLLSRVARVLVQHRVSLHTARVTTLGLRAEDVFLVKGGALNTPKGILALETDLVEAVRV